MYFNSMIDFLQMHGYAIYVWSSYVIVFVFLFINVFIPIFAKKRFFQNHRLKKSKIENYVADISNNTNLNNHETAT